MRRAEIAPAGGNVGCPAARSARVNQRASSSSPSRRLIAAERATARTPSISEAGNGHGCDESYATSATCTPVSSATSRATASTRLSPGSTNPAMVDYRPAGHAACRPNKARSPLASMTSTMIAGSRRGKVSLPQDSRLQRMTCPARADWLAAPQAPQ